MTDYPSPRTLTVACFSGLANRLRVLLSGTVLARATGREFRMIWPSNEACGATFDRLFDGDWRVQASASHAGPRLVAFHALGTSPPPDLLKATEADLAILHVGSFFAAHVHPHHAAHAAEADRLIDRLAPAPLLQQRVDRFAASHFRPSMIGVHLRRGDFVRRHPDVVANTAPAMACVDRLLERDAGAGILLSTDDGGPDQVTGRSPREHVREQFSRRYGDRVVWTEPRSLDRRDAAGVEDAVVDLWLLRRTHAVVGTTGSSFSELAAMGRPVSVTWCAAPTARYVRLARFARVSGFEAALRALPLTARLGPHPTLPAMWSFYASLPGALGRRVKRLLTPPRG